MKFFEHRFPPPFVAAFMGVAMWSIGFLETPMRIEPRLHFLVTAFLAIFALVISGSAMIAFRRAKTTINPVQIDRAAQVVTNGVFRYTRNPMYVGLTALLTSWAVLLALPWAFFGPVVFALFIHRFQIIPEERVMSARFGEEYERYRQHVRRWL